MPQTTIRKDLPSMDKLSLGKDTWKPLYLAKLPNLRPDALSKIPVQDVITFHPDFIRNTLDGVTWSPGLRFITGKGPCMLKNRTYYLIDPSTEPFLPEGPGKHGAKLTAFFNKSPEEKYGDLLDEDADIYEDVPMFILVNKRYTYFGNYSQTRWSDKLDYDTMMTRVPTHVKEFWAEELTSPAREDWVTEELKKHFFCKPEYVGRLFATADDDTAASEDEVKLNEKMTRDVRKYVEELREWEREAKMKTALIKKQFILDSFHAVSTGCAGCG